MENQSAKPKKTILNYGVILGVVSVVMGVIAYVLNMHLEPHWGFMVVGILIFAGFLIYGIKNFKNENGGFLSIGEALKVGLGIALIAALIGAAWTFALTTIIEPDYMEQMAEVQRDQMLENFPDMTDEQMDNAMEMNAKFTSPWITMAFGIVGNLFIGFIIALIAGAVMKQRRPYEV